MTAKEMLAIQLDQAFDGRADMSLMGSLAGLTEAEAAYRPSPDTPSVDEIARHIAWSKSRFCQQAFGSAMILEDPGVTDEGDSEGVPWEFPCGCAFGRALAPGVAGVERLLRDSHAVMIANLDALAESELMAPLPVHHGSSAFNCFWVMIQHDLFHAGQIRTRRTAAGLAGGRS